MSVVVGACVSSKGVLLAICWLAGGWNLGLLACLHRLSACLAGFAAMLFFVVFCLAVLLVACFGLASDWLLTCLLVFNFLLCFA